MSQIVDVSEAGTIQETLHKAGVAIAAGDVLCYKVQKKEDVSAAKTVVLAKGSSASDCLVGDAARSRVGLAGGKGSVQPSDVPAGFSCFVQSTSHSRKLPAGSAIFVLRPGAKCSTSATESANAKAAEKRAAPAASHEPAAKKAKTELAKAGAVVAASGSWQTIESVHVKDYGTSPSACIAGFDMDSTLINTKSGKTFPVNKDDWEVWSPKCASKLQEMHKNGTKIVIITNQGGIEKGKTKLGDITDKIDGLQKALGVPLLAMVLSKGDLFRKPLPGAWALLEDRFNGGVKIDLSKSSYCGDAAGRVPPDVKKKDFSAGDLKFALNVGIDFKTPEELFLDKPQKYSREFQFDPRKLGVKPTAFPVAALKKKTLILTIGAPGSGKSAAATSHFSECVRINQDTLKTKDKCLKACETALKEGKSVVVDNQNKTKADRAPYIALAKATGAAAIGLYYDVPKELCFHLNAYRLLNKSSELHRAEKVPPMIIHGFFKNGQKPETAEGLQEVHTIGLEHFKLSGNVDAKLLRSFID